MVLDKFGLQRISLRKTAKQLSYRMRYKAMSSHDQVNCRKWKKILQYLIIINYCRPEDKFIEEILPLIAMKYLSLAYEDPDSHEPPEKPLRLVISVDSFTASQCKIFFKFNKEELQRIFNMMTFPDECKFDNNGSMSGEEVFLRGLYEACNSGNKQVICETLMGGEYTRPSRAFIYFIEHIYDRFRHLVHNSLGWWYRNGLLKQSATAIHDKMIAAGFPRELILLHRTCLFVDCNCLPTSVVGGGPTEDGANAARFDESVQRAFYNGWKSVHGLKHQTIDTAHGITVEIYGPTSLRRNDLTLLRDSNINGRLAQLQADLLHVEELLHIFGDSAYPELSHLHSYLKNRLDLTAEYQRKYNSAMKKVRISIEWNYGFTATLFKYLQDYSKLKLLESPVVSKVYTVCTILRNCYAILYGCQTSNYFNLSLPTDFLV